MKKCFKCGLLKDQSEFYAHPQMADGLLGKCKDCTKNDVKDHREKNHEKVCAYDRSRRKFRKPRRFADKTEEQKQHALVCSRVFKAVKRGILLKPETCPMCGGGGRIEAHHHDYSKPLEVVWACFKCHREKFHGARVDVAHHVENTKWVLPKV